MGIDLLRQLTGTAGDCQVNAPGEKPYGLMISMGGDDKTVVCGVYRRAA
jgi:hypothetical protein